MILYFKITLNLIRLCRHWPRLVMSRVLGKYLRRPIAIDFIELKNGTRFFLDNQTLASADLFILSEVWGDHFYDYDKAFIIKPGDVVFDIGANKGFFTVYAAQKVLQSGAVYAFEPAPKNFHILQKNLEINRLSNVVASAVAVSGHKGDVELYLSKTNDGGHSVFEDDVKADYKGELKTGSIFVPTIELQAFCERNKVEKIDFMKVDCEGGEYDIFLNLSAEFYGKIAKIAMEYHSLGGHLVEELIKVLKENNFDVKVHEQALFALNKSFLK